MTDNRNVGEDVRNFYNTIQFPGKYTKQQFDEYDLIANNIYIRFINKYLKTGQTVIDVGCGSGLVTNLLAEQHDCQFTAFDFSDSIHIGKTYADRHNLKNVSWIQNDILNYNFQTQFDVVICQGVLHHIPEHNQALTKLKSLVAPGGILLLGVYNPFGKFFKKFINLNYNSDVLYQDQKHNPYETAFYAGEVICMCQPFEFLEAAPGGNNKYACNVLSLFNSINSGLTLYAFRNNYV